MINYCNIDLPRGVCPMTTDAACEFLSFNSKSITKISLNLESDKSTKPSRPLSACASEL
jgi:phenylalanyl-tRNA synthetase beta subunit